MVADALDAVGLRSQVLDPAVRPLFAGATVAGRALPVAVEADESLPDPPYEQWIRLAEAVEPDDVVVLAVGGGAIAASWGELFSCAARGRGGRGAVTDGLVRDARQIEELGFPVFARGCSPLDTHGRAQIVSIGEEVRCGGVAVRRGDYVLGDADGVVCVPAGRAAEVMALVDEKAEKETGGRDDLLAGVPVREVWNRYGVF